MNTRSSSMSYHNKKGKVQMSLSTSGKPSFPCTYNCPVKKAAPKKKEHR